MKDSQRIVLDSSHATEVAHKRHLQKMAMCNVIVYLIFMMVYFTMLFSQFRITESFELERSLRNYMTDPSGVKTLNGVFGYLENSMMPALFPEEKWYNGDVYSSQESGFILNYNKLVAGFSLIQKRVDTNVTCDVSKRFATFLPECWPALSEESISTKIFGRERNPVQYHVDEGTMEFSQRFPMDPELSNLMLMELKRNRWLDKQTRSLEANFVIFNRFVRRRALSCRCVLSAVACPVDVC
jgi:hypothetical protein